MGATFKEAAQMHRHKICLISHLFPCDQQDYKGNFVRDLAVELSYRGHEVHVVTPMRPGAVREEAIDGVFVHRFAYYGWRRGIQLGQLKGNSPMLLGSLILLGTMKCLLSVLKHNSDLVHAYWVVPGGLIGLIAGRLTRRPVVATAAGSDLTTAPEYRLARLLTTLTLKHLDRVLPVSTAMKKIAMKLGLPGDRGTVIHGPVGIDTGDLKETAKQQPFTEKYGRSLIYVGNLTAPKRAETIIRAMQKVTEMYADCRLVLIGEGTLRPSLEALADELGLRKHVHFCGALPHEEVLQMLKCADVFVHCSDYEGLGMAVMEAMGAGLPVVASRVGGVPDLVLEGKTGFMIPPDDVERYAEKILLLLKNDQLRQELGSNARRFAEKHLNKQTILAQLETVYGEILASARKKRGSTQFSR
jgi:glycosyltransferase involved in cell wall biosynthesis